MALIKKVIRMAGDSIPAASNANSGMYVACTVSSSNSKFSAGNIYYSDGTDWTSVGGGVNFVKEAFPDGAIRDEGNNEITDESGEGVLDENSILLITGFGEDKIGAERAKCDAEGNEFRQTYAKKSEILPPVSNGGELTPAATIAITNNTLYSVNNTELAAITFNLTKESNEIANFAIELNTSVACTINVTVNGSAIKRSAATDGSTEASKFYQITCVGTCWTMAEFVTP